MRLGSWNDNATYKYLGIFNIGGTQSNDSSIYTYGHVVVHLQKTGGATAVKDGAELRVAGASIVYLHGSKQITSNSNFYFGGASTVNNEGGINLSGVVNMQGYDLVARKFGFSTANSVGIFDFAGDDADMRVLGAGEKTILAFAQMDTWTDGASLRLKNYDDDTCMFLLDVEANIKDYLIYRVNEDKSLSGEWYKSDSIVTLDGVDYYRYTASQIVPEASTVAAIFGALALGFVAYRRRK